MPSNATYTSLAWPPATGGAYFVNWNQFSVGVYVADLQNDPLVAVNVQASSWGYAAGTIYVHLAKGVTGDPGSDASIVIINDHQVHNFWQFNRIDDNTATAQAYGVADISLDTGWGSHIPFRGAGINAAGASLLAGTLIQAETDAGDIHHALAIALAAPLQNPGFVAPAIAGDGVSSSGIAQTGNLFAIPPATTMPNGLSPLGQKVFRCLQTYGAYNVDNGGSTNLRAQTNAYDTATIAALISDVQVLIPMLQKVN